MTEKYFGVLLNPRSPNCRLAIDTAATPKLFGNKKSAKKYMEALLYYDPTLKCRVIKVDCCYEMPR